MIMADILDRIERKLKDVGLSASAASLAAGLSKDAIRNIRRSKLQGIDAGVNIRTVEALAPVLKTSKAWLLGEDDSPQERYDVRIPFFDIAELPDRRQEFMAGKIEAADAARTVRVSAPKGDVVATRLDDHSMSHVIPKHSIVLIDMSRTILEKQGIYAVSVSGGGVVLRAYEDNPDRFVPSSVIGGFKSYFDMRAIEVIGRAVAIYKEI